MWTQIKQQYQNWDLQVMTALRDPSSIPQKRAGYVLCFIAKLSTIERLQLLKFCQEFRGQRLFLSIVLMTLGFSLFALPLHWFRPEKSVLSLLIMANLLGWILSTAFIGLWFNYRKIIEHPFKLLVGSSFAVMLGFIAANWLSSIRNGTSLLDKLIHDTTSLLIILAAMLAYSLIIAAIAIWRSRSASSSNCTVSVS